MIKGIVPPKIIFSFNQVCDSLVFREHKQTKAILILDCPYSVSEYTVLLESL